MTTSPEPSPSAPLVPARALVILVLGLLAAWLAAGSLGWIAPALQKTLSWVAFAIIILGALPGSRRLNGRECLLLAGATALALALTAVSSPVANISAVAIVLAAVAWVRPGMSAKVSGPAALAVTTLAVYRLACDSSATLWTFAHTLGRGEGQWAAWLTGRPLAIGASFGGVDFLVLMFALTAAWAVLLPSPSGRGGRAAWAVLFILLAQNAYLVLLACNDDLLALLPPQTAPKYTDISFLGVWTWASALRSLLPWNLPLLAALLQAAVAVGMFRLAARPVAPDDLAGETEIPPAAVEGRRRNRSLQGEAGPSGRLHEAKPWQRFAAAGLLILAVAAMTLSLPVPDLAGRRIVAYDDGTIDWGVTDPGPVPPGKAPRYGLLPVLVESLGGKFVRSRDLATADLQDADVLVVLPGKTEIPDDLQLKAQRYVAGGGRLVVAGNPETTPGAQENVLNKLLAATAMSFRDDTANSLTERWEDNLQSSPSAATAGSQPGRDHFSFDRAASIRVSWPAGPMIVGRWAWDEVGADPDRPEPLPYSPGSHLGDLVLAARQQVGRGTVVALGATACLSNDGIPMAYTFTGPLLSALAADQPSPQAWWRQLLGLLAAGAAIVVLYRQFAKVQAGSPQHGFLRQAAAAGIALSLAVLVCDVFNQGGARLLPAGDKQAAAPIVYVDGSHLENLGRDPWSENGIGRFMRVLAENGYLPLVAPDVSADRLSKAAMLVSIAPAKEFTSEEIAAVHGFVDQGGFFLSMVGSPDAGPSRPLLAAFDLHIQPTPVPPWVMGQETVPLGRFWYPDEEHPSAEFFAAWPVFGKPAAEAWSKPVIVGSKIGAGQAFLIGDTGFALKKSFDDFEANVNFWREQLKTWIGHANKTAAAEPGTAGIAGLPKPNADKGAAP